MLPFLWESLRADSTTFSLSTISELAARTWAADLTLGTPLSARVVRQSVYDGGYCLYSNGYRKGWLAFLHVFIRWLVLIA